LELPCKSIAAARQVDRQGCRELYKAFGWFDFERPAGDSKEKEWVNWFNRKENK